MDRVRQGNCVVLDFETTGFSPNKNKIIEIGAVRLRDWEVVEEFSNLINPEENIPYYITKITGLTTKDVVDKPTIKEVMLRFIDFIGEDTIVAHNLPFDFSFLKWNIRNMELDRDYTGGVCTLKLVKEMYPQLPSHKLGDCVKEFNLGEHDSHRALGDVKVTARLLERLMNERR